ncbi:peptidoglycan DD-metalloendopeptidase family protein [Seonamhaeicola marinus]|uniref:Peptidoglycan DD-metalloendopeptidase family protein n=1 Tax=Seonamhaeicola marinus TaxID=1912246 RepID=A0A5D0HJC6_9FLAO|nr:peptidoglycan DD-metalloendopeptidase family protein [Seonamhaeicola marinus]TYA71388.1 peptidoglycan DD-metalloendopeptidase family protein [Seonamhaeicola marinus]
MQSTNFIEFLKGLDPKPLYVLDKAMPLSSYVPIDLSDSNESLNEIDVASAEKLGAFVNNHIANHNAKVAYGGYLEVRNIYKRSTHFNKQAKEERNIHIAIDLWCEAKTPIYAPLNAKVHSFKNNTNYGDYGPTIILEHNVEHITFYTLYGHLSLESIDTLKVGQIFEQGEQIGSLGDAAVNGNYPPHLHFQIIRDLQGNLGDYPGVCAKQNLEFYKQNCPDPSYILHL